jgi:hypothetical protein
VPFYVLFKLAFELVFELVFELAFKLTFKLTLAFNLEVHKRFMLLMQPYGYPLICLAFGNLAFFWADCPTQLLQTRLPFARAF